MHSLYFDLDGTLTDPKLGITRSIQYALGKLDLEVPDVEDLTWCIGPPLLDSFKTIIGDSGQAARAVQLYRERFSDTGLFENHVYPEMINTLERLQKTGYTLYVATSKPTPYAARIIEHFQMTAFFARIFGSQLDGSYADKSDLLQFALEQTKDNPLEAIMIGDRSHDMVGAKNNGMKAIGVLYGFGSEEELISAGADSISSSVELLEPSISKIDTNL